MRALGAKLTLKYQVEMRSRFEHWQRKCRFSSSNWPELPDDLSFGQLQVSCEGYESSDDERVLKGSCALIYELVETPTARGAQQQQRARRQDFAASDSKGGGGGGSGLLTFLMVIFIIFVMCKVCCGKSGKRDPHPPTEVR